MLLTDIGLSIMLLIVLSCYFMRRYGVLSQVWLSAASVGLFCSVLAITFCIAYAIL